MNSNRINRMGSNLMKRIHRIHHIQCIQSIRGFILILLIAMGFNHECLATEHVKIKLLAFSGSIRKDSNNTKALKLLADAATQAGAQVTIINLADYPLPMYNGDLEEKEGLPKNATLLQTLIAEHDGLLVASPEYNGFPTPLLMNVFDWTSRTVKNNPNTGLQIFKGKPVALISASPGEGGGARGLSIASTLLKNLGMQVVPLQVTIKKSATAFNAKGELNDAKIAEVIKREGEAIVKAAK